MLLTFSGLVTKAPYNAVFSGEAFDAQGWVLSGDSVVNVIIVKDNKVAWGRAYGLANDETVKPVFAALTEEKK